MLKFTTESNPYGEHLVLVESSHSPDRTALLAVFDSPEAATELAEFFSQLALLRVTPYGGIEQ